MTSKPDTQQFYHGTKASLQEGDLLAPGFASNYGKRKVAAYVYLTATLEAATWGAELALGDEGGRIYSVEPTGPIEDDPNLTEKKFPATQRNRIAPATRFAFVVRLKSGPDTLQNSLLP